MLIPVRQLSPAVPAPRTPVSGGESDDPRLQSNALLAGAALRSLVLMLGLLSLRSTPGQTPTLMVAVMVSLAGLLACLFRPLPFGPALLIDTAAIGLLIHATGDAASPFLALTLALVLLGAVSGGGRDALVGGGAGVLVLLAACLVGPAERRETTFGMAIAQAAISGVAALVLGGGRGAALLGRGGHAEQQRRYDEALRALDWQRMSVAALNAATTLPELAARVAERAMTITRMPSTVDLGQLGEDQPADDPTACSVAIPLAGARPGRITVRVAPEALDRAQRDALDALAAMAAMRAGELRSSELLRRQQDGVMALWEAVGMVRAAPGLDDTMRDAFRRIARALDLDWLALVGPGERQMIAPLMLVSGTPAADPPRVQGCQLRVAAEAMRLGRPLVRAEGGAALACLPMRLGNDTPLVLVAHGAASEAGTQALLMVFGDLVAAQVGG